jgi:NADH-quinone oxidoreductase subunit M
MNLLSFIIALPLLGALLVGTLAKVKLAKQLALSIASIELLLSLAAVYHFSSDNSGFQLQENAAWIPSLNIAYSVGVDGISVLFLPMTALLTWMTMLASWHSAAPLNRLHFALLLALEGLSMGIFSALDMVLFFVFWELTLPPIFLLIGLWGIGPKRRHAASKYTLYMLAGGVPLLLAIIVLALNHAAHVNGTIPHDLSFNYQALLETPLPDNLQTPVFFLLLLGFAVKAPLVPLHTWLPQAAMEGPAAVAALLTGIKLGVYGLLRFALPLAPSAAVEYNWVLGILGAIALIYGGLIAIQQSNLRRLLAYASISHVGLVVIGIASLTVQGIQGAVFQLLNFTLIAGSLMLIAGFIQQRLGSTEALHLGGLAKAMPKLRVCYFLFALASMGVPGTSGFPAELLLILGILSAHPSLGVTALAGAILGAAYTLNFARRVFLGSSRNPDIALLQDLQKRELSLLCIPALIVLAFGFCPNTLLSINQKAAEVWLSRLLEQPGMEGEGLVMNLRD